MYLAIDLRQVSGSLANESFRRRPKTFRKHVWVVPLTPRGRLLEACLALTIASEVSKSML